MSQCPSDEMFQHFEERIPCLSTESLVREDQVYNSEISAEGLEHALKRLKLRNGQDGIVSEPISDTTIEAQTNLQGHYRNGGDPNKF